MQCATRAKLKKVVGQNPTKKICNDSVATKDSRALPYKKNVRRDSMKTILKKYGILAIMSVFAVVLSFTACQQATGGTGNKTGDGANLRGQMFTIVMFDSTQAMFSDLLVSIVPYTLKDKTVTFDFSAVKKDYADKSAEAIVFMDLERQVSYMEKDLNGGHVHPDKKESTREIITTYKGKITSKEQAIAFLEAQHKLYNSSSYSGEQEYNTMVQMNTNLKPKVAEWLAGSTNIIATLSDTGDKLTFTSLLVFGRQNGYEIKSNYEVAKGQGGGQ